MAWCPHGANGDPERCSQCLGVRPRTVRSDENGVTIDGSKVRDSLIVTGPSSPGDWRKERRRGGRPKKSARHATPRPRVELELLDIPFTDPEPDVSDFAPSSEAEESATTDVPAVETDVATDTAPDPATALAECNRPEILQSPLTDSTPAHAESMVHPAARVTRATRDKRPPPGRPLVTAAQLQAAHSIVDYAETHATLAFPTPAGCEAIALLDGAIDLAGSDVEIAELHRLPRLPIRDVLFAVVMMAGTGATVRAVARDLPALQAAGYVSAPMHYNSLSRALHDPVIVDALARLVEETERRSGAPAQPQGAAISRMKSAEASAAEELAISVWRNIAHLAHGAVS